MSMKKAAVNKMLSSYYFCVHHLLYVVVLGLFLIFVGSFSSLFLSILLSFTTISIISTFLFTFTKQKQAFGRNEVKHDIISSTLKTPELEEPEIEAVISKKETQEVEVGQVEDYFINSVDILSESESGNLSSTSEDSDVDWPFGYNMDRILACSDDSISDDESLIEIALPEGNYLYSKDESKLKSYSNLPGTIFRQEGLMELLAEINEMNEEDNLIEIDISMGSIKYSRLEIEA